MKRFARTSRLFFTLALVPVLIFSAVACAPEKEASDRVGVVVTILPQAEFVENVGGTKVKVTVMVPPGASPHTYEPKPTQMTALAEAEMYAKVGSGVEFELVWMDKLIATNKEMVVVDCSEGVKLQEMVAEDGNAEDEHEEEHHGGMDPHIWMSPLNAQIMVRNICAGLITVDPENRSYYEQNRDAYLKQLAEIDGEMRDGLSEVKNRRFMVYHPAFGYFAREYNLTMLPIEWEGKEPTAAGLASLIEQAKAHDIRVIFAEPQFDPKSAEVIAEAIGGRVVLIDPLARDYIANLRLIMNEMLPVME
ncbi:MAG TPA: zinc ABC transporter solute-binding protein [Dehalococcoidia bacterium]|nr:zinc ABC transporter solute-binding protein [Dehalococcoidia bacterium]